MAESALAGSALAYLWILIIMKEEPMTLKKIMIRLPALLIAGGIWFLSSQSTLPQPKGILGIDKIQHMAAYLVLAMSIGIWISSAFWQERRFLAFLLVVLFASVYGVMDEVHQYFTPGRDCNVWDWIADVFGAVSGAAAMMWANIWLLHKIKAGFKAAA
ncbi:MAG: VanZ family protein [Treponema sp.]|nr:VanZ family protein [Treponema sp.]